MNDIIVRISQILEKKNLTEKELLLNCDINTSFLTDWKKGRLKAPSYDKLLKISNYLNIPLDWLIKGESLNVKFTDNEIYIIDLYRQISNVNKIKLEGILEYMIHEEKNKKTKSSNSIISNDEKTA